AGELPSEAPSSPSSDARRAPRRSPTFGRWQPAISPTEPEQEDPVALRAAAEQIRDPRAALAQLQRAFLLAPGDLETLAALIDAADRANAGRIASHARSLLARFVDGPPPPPVPPPSRDRVASLVREPGEDPVREIWRVLWEQAAPLFRRAPRKLPQPNDRVTRVATTPEARAFAHVLDALGRDDLPAFYFDRKEAAELRIARTSPPTLLAGAGF
ncbi:MAG TPA: hypothetical protein DEF51_11440, partial [Myxococcales bacterium]|nr:hypothetical protein [Myxococcales bacterium]